MAARDVVIALVPGSFATTIMYDRVIPILESAGYAVEKIELPSANDGSLWPAPSMLDDAAHIHSRLVSLLDSGRDVVLCVQSYGGMPGSQACQDLSANSRGRLSERQKSHVKGIVYAASYMPDVGESIRGIMAAYIPDDQKNGFPGGYYPRPPPESCTSVFSDMLDERHGEEVREKAKEEILRYGRAMTAHSSDTYSGVVTFAAWREIPGTTIIPGDDVIVATAEQEKMHERAKREGARIKRVFVDGGGHGITVSRADLVAGELIALAEGDDIYDK